MKKYVKIGSIIIGIAIGFLAYHWTKKPCPVPDSNGGVTSLSIKNSSELDSVICWVTLQGDDSVHGMFGIKGFGSQGHFMAVKDSTYTYTDADSLLGFEVSFGNVNGACDQASPWPKYGVNVGEGSINCGTESADISAVDGVNTFMKMSVSGNNSKHWKLGNDSIFTTTTNKTLGNNANVIGVFPYQCTNCTYSNSPPPLCKVDIPVKCSDKPICTINRDNQPGGTLLFEFTGFVEEPLK